MAFDPLTDAILHSDAPDTLIAPATAPLLDNVLVITALPAIVPMFDRPLPFKSIVDAVEVI